jgi:hypothetical protein
MGEEVFTMVVFALFAATPVKLFAPLTPRAVFASCASRLCSLSACRTALSAVEGARPESLITGPGCSFSAEPSFMLLCDTSAEDEPPDPTAGETSELPGLAEQGRTLPSPIAFRTFALTCACCSWLQPAGDKSKLCVPDLSVERMTDSGILPLTMLITSAFVICWRGGSGCGFNPTLTPGFCTPPLAETEPEDGSAGVFCVPPVAVIPG